MTVAEMVGTLGLDVKESEWTKGAVLVTGLEAAVNLLSRAVSAAAGLVEQFVGDTMAAGLAADRMSKALGISTEDLQALGYAAGAVGVEAKDLHMALKSLAERATDASHGNDELRATFGRLGVSVTDASGKLKAPDALLSDLADGLQRMGGSSERAALASKLMGDAGLKLLPLLDGGAEGIARFTDEARALGVVLDADAVAASVEFDKSLHRLDGGLKGLRNLIAGPLLPVLQQAVDAITAWMKANREVIKQNIAAVFARLIPVLEATGRLLASIGKAALFLLEHWRSIAIVAGGILLGALMANNGALAIQIALWLSTQAAAVGAALATAGAWLLAAAPFILLGIAIAMLAEEIYAFATDGESVLGDFVYLVTDNFKTLGIIVGEVWQSITEAVSGAVESAKDAVGRAADWIEIKLIAVRDAIVEAFKGALDAVMGPLQTAAGLLDTVTGGAAGGLLDMAGGGFNALFGGGASSPAAAAGMSTSTSNSSRQVNINSPIEMRVTAAPSMSTEAVGGIVADSLSDQMDRMWSDAAASVGV